MKAPRSIGMVALAVCAAGLLRAHVIHAQAAQFHAVNLMVSTAFSPPGPGFCIDASLAPGRADRVVYIYQCHGRENQRWTFTDNEDGTSAIVGHDGLCLDIRGRQVGDGTPLQLYRCHFGPNQRFRITPSRHIQEVQSGKCLTIGPAVGDGRPVFIDNCQEGLPAQIWNFRQ